MVSGFEGPLGLCIRAGACTYGFDNAVEMMKKRKSKLVIISSDASEKTIEKILSKCKFYEIESKVLDLCEVKNKLKIKDSIKIISVNDINFKKLMDKRLKGET